MSLTKVLKTALENVKLMSQQMIKNEQLFSCQTIKLCQEELYPEEKEIYKWYEELFIKTIKSKVLNEKALEAMKKKGIEPKKQPSDIMLIIIVDTYTDIYCGIMKPEKIDIDIDKFTKTLINNKKVEITNMDKYKIFKYSDISPLKEKDNLQRDVFRILKEMGLYKEEEEEDIILFDI